MRYLTSGMYVGVFATAYCTFLFQHYSADAAAVYSGPIASINSIKTPENAALIATPLLPAPDQPRTKSSAASNRTDANNHRQTEMHAAPEQKHDNGQTHKIAMIEVSSTKPIQRAAQPKAIRWSSSTYTSNNAISSNTTDTGGASKNRPATTVSSNAPSSASENIVGGQYLPDGKSQEDLYNSQSRRPHTNPVQSKGPHTYSIEDYRKSSAIDCNSVFGDGTDARTRLIRDLKGC